MIYGCLIAHFTLSLNIYSSLCTPQLIPDMRRRSVQSARLTLEAKRGFSHYWFTFTIFSARLSNWNSSRQIRQPLLCLTYFQQKVIFLTIFCYIFETQSALKGLWNIGEATVDWRFWPICHRISFASFCSQRPFTGKVIETSAQISLQRIKVVRSSFYPASNISGEKICTHGAHSVSVIPPKMSWNTKFSC